MSDKEPNDIEDEIEDEFDGEDVDAEADIVRREAGVRLRTNIQAGSASERVNVTGEVHARDMSELVTQLPSYREVLGEQVDWAHYQAQTVNE